MIRVRQDGAGEIRVKLAYICDIIDGCLRIRTNVGVVWEGFIMTAEIPITINKLVEIIIRIIIIIIETYMVVEMVMAAKIDSPVFS